MAEKTARRDKAAEYLAQRNKGTGEGQWRFEDPILWGRKELGDGEKGEGRRVGNNHNKNKTSKKEMRTQGEPSRKSKRMCKKGAGTKQHRSHARESGIRRRVEKKKNRDKDTKDRRRQQGRREN